MYPFLGLNGFRIAAPEEEVVDVVLSLASGDVDESGLADWLRQHMTPR
jgi:death-on-curing protein